MSEYIGKVVINAGHKIGMDPGAVNSELCINEATIVLKISELTVDLLNRKYGVEAYLIQENELQDIVNKVNTLDPDAVISEHLNSSDNKTAQGAEIFTTYGQNNSDILATFVFNEYKKMFPDLYWREDWSDGDADKESGFYILKGINAPVVLIEFMFISNNKEGSMISDPINQMKAAEAVAQGCLKFLKHMNK